MSGTSGFAPSARRAGPWRLLDMSFRAKLLVSFVGTVGFLGLASLAVVRIQTDRQIDWMIQRTTERAQGALGELERFRRAELERLAQRITGSVRIVAALEAALEPGGAPGFVDDVRYELALAQFERGLVAFHDGEGRPVLTLVDGTRVSDAERQDDQARETVRTGVASAGYRRLDQSLFAVQRHRLELFGVPLGTVTLGFPLEHEMVARLGEIVGADICFAAGGQCLVGTPATRQGTLAERLLAAARAGTPVQETIDGHRFALVATPLPATEQVVAAVAVPLDDALRPFDRIHQVERIAAAAALAIAVLLGLALSTGLTTPIRTLVAATERVGRGEYAFRVTVPHRDEVGQLADAFNQMTQGLLLKERYRGVLDKVVSPDVAEELMKGDLRLGGETREISTLFADIRGFTALSERMAPEDVLGLLNEWFELAGAAVEEHGGVVDKYVGDQVMAIFGAPLRQDDHAERAVRAALRLRDETASLGGRRVARGQPPFAIGIGITSGPAVAGNVGSSKRMNYTVLGASINAASRLCSEAAPGELLIAEATYEAVADFVDATAAPARISKGFSRPITPYSVHGYRVRGNAPPGRPSAIVLSALILSLAFAPGAQAQVLDLPTFADLGWRYVSPGGLVEIQPSLKIDIDGHFPGDASAWHLEGTKPFLAGAGRLFVDLFVGRRLYTTVELRLDRGQPPRAGPLRAHLQQAFARLTVSHRAGLRVQAGKFISPFGGYPQRAHTPSDPLVRPPLLYDYRTVMQASRVPGASDGVFDWKDNPDFRATGLPVVWDAPYPVGALATIGGTRWHLAAGVVTTAPSAEPEDWNRITLSEPAGPSIVARASGQLLPELGIGASFSRGSYMRPTVAVVGEGLGRQVQESRGLDATFRRGHLAIHSEIVFNSWEVFRVTDTPRDVSYYIEARQALAPGFYVAGRYGAIHFRALERQAGGLDRWDYGVRRWQIGAGYRLGRSSEVRGEYMINRTLDVPDPRDNLVSVRWSISF